MRGLPSREWRTISNNYGSTDEGSSFPSTYKEKILHYLLIVWKWFLFFVKFVLSKWKLAFAWSVSQTNKKKQICFTSSLVSLSLLFVYFLLSLVINYFSKENPCSVAERTKVQLLEEDENSGIYTSPLPKKIHQYPNSIFAQDIQQFYSKSTYQHTIWSPENIDELIRKKYSWISLENREDLNSVAKFVVLNEYGGIFIDLEYKPLVNFWGYLPVNHPALLESPYKYKETVRDVLISSPPGHPFWNITLNIVYDRLTRGVSLGGILDEALEKSKNEGVIGDSVYLLPCENFYRMPKKGFVSYLLSMTTLLKPCGSVEDEKCLYGKIEN